MSELRQVDRVMLEKIRRIELLLSGMYGTGEQWRAEAECTRALLTEQPEPDAPQEVEQESIRRDAEEVPPVSGAAQPHNERAQRSSGFDAGGVTGTAPPTSVEQSGPGLSDDSINRISLAVRLQQAEEQRDQYKEKLDTLVGLVREYREAIGDVLERCTPKTYSAEIRTCRAMFAYAEEVGGSE